MKSTSGHYYPRLDHVRALATFQVYFWHVTHIGTPFSYVPDLFFLSIFEEGFTGVALFMTLSGYIFAKLVSGKEIDYSSFIRNRFIRLAPLLMVVFIYAAIWKNFNFWSFLRGFVGPNWPNGGWSIATELHFYLIFPVIIFLQRRMGLTVLGFGLAGSCMARTIIWWQHGEVQSFAYWTIVGRLDQFLMGMLWFEFSSSAYLKRHADMILLTSFVGFAWFWHFFNIRGGFAHNPSYPSPSALWIVLPTIEGAAYGCIIASYEHAKFALSGPLGRAVALIGMVSYSVYLWHFTAIAQLAPLFPKPEGFAQSGIAAIATFPLMVGLGYLSYRLIEMPFFRFRVPYLGSGSIKAHRMPR